MAEGVLARGVAHRQQHQQGGQCRAQDAVRIGAGEGITPRQIGRQGGQRSAQQQQTQHAPRDQRAGEGGAYGGDSDQDGVSRDDLPQAGPTPGQQFPFAAAQLEDGAGDIRHRQQHQRQDSPGQQPHRALEAIEFCLEAVRDLLEAADKLHLGMIRAQVALDADKALIQCLEAAAADGIRAGAQPAVIVGVGRGARQHPRVESCPGGRSAPVRSADRRHSRSIRR